MPANNNIEIEIINLTDADYAPKAQWATGQLLADGNNTTNDSTITWMNSDGDSNGFVRYDAVTMEDSAVYNALRMHPKWVNNGTIKGWLPPFFLSGPAIFTAQIGFLNGATATDGVNFQLWIHYWDNTGNEQWINVLNQFKNYSNTLQNISVDLSRWSKQKIKIELRVDAGNSSGQDWAAWINPIVTITKQLLPVIADINNAKNIILDDRYDEKVKWYLPNISLSTNKNNFDFICALNGINTYKGTVQFNLLKTIPSVVAEYKNSNADADCREIPLSNLIADFNLQINGIQTPFRTSITQNDTGDYLLNLDMPNQEGLATIYVAISNAAFANFCSIKLSGVYAGCIPIPTVDFNKINIARNFFQQRFIRQNINVARINPTLGPPPSNAKLMMANRVNRFEEVQNFNQPIQAIFPVIAPSIENKDAFSSKADMAFEVDINDVNFSCLDFPNNYYINDAIHHINTPFACNPPFPAANANAKRYQELSSISNVDLQKNGANNVYLNTINNTYLIIPQRYVIALAKTGNIYIPACYFFTNIDATGINNSTANFKFDVVPDISEYQLLQIKKIIYNKFFTADSNTTIDDVIFDFPQTIKDKQNVIFNATKPIQTNITEMGIYQWGVTGNKYFHIDFLNVNIGDGSAAAVANFLKLVGGNLIQTISFDIDSNANTLPQSSILLSLNTINSYGLTIKIQDDSSISLVNKTLYDITISNFTSNTIDNVTSLKIAANSSVNAPNQINANSLFNFSYTANADYIDKILYEKRFTIDQQVKDILCITNNTGLFSMYKINKIDFYISIVKQGETDLANALTSAYLPLTQDGIINQIEYALPVANFLSKWSIYYKTTINFLNGTTLDNTPQLIDDINSIGKIINLTVSNLCLQTNSTN